MTNVTYAAIPGHTPSSSWPTEGVIVAEGLQVRYRPELDLVLRDLSFTVRGRDKVRERVGGHTA